MIKFWFEKNIADMLFGLIVCGIFLVIFVILGIFSKRR